MSSRLGGGVTLHGLSTRAGWGTEGEETNLAATC